MISLEARKIAIAQALFDLDNEFILKEIERILFHEEDNDSDIWTPTKEELEGIKEAMKQVENGEFVSEEEAKERYKKWLK
jgi:hypothetical protein